MKNSFRTDLDAIYYIRDRHMIIFTLEIALTERDFFARVQNAMDQFYYIRWVFRDEEYRALCPLSRITVISITFLIESDAVKKVYRRAVKILVTVSRETYGRPRSRR